MTQIFTGVLVLETCCNCGMHFGMEASYQKKRLDDQQSFYCPNGHPQHYTGPTPEQKLKRQLEEAQKVIDFNTNRINKLHDNLTIQKNKTRAEKAAKTRLKNRVKNGICPCCNRSVKQLADHMKMMHPEYVEAKPINPLLVKINNKVL